MSDTYDTLRNPHHKDCICVNCEYKNMTPSRFKQIRHSLGLSISQMANAIGVEERTIRRYESGDREIGKPVQILLRYISFYGILSNESEAP